MTGNTKQAEDDEPGKAQPNADTAIELGARWPGFNSRSQSGKYKPKHYRMLLHPITQALSGF
jgi:hypothetical protein